MKNTSHVIVAMSIAASLPFSTTAAGATVLPAATPAPVKCAIPKACAMFTNSSSGTALEGVANSGSGLTGISSSGAGLYGLSISGTYFEPGVEGESANADGNDAGGVFGANVFITGVAPEYGMLGYGSGYGVVGEAESAGAQSSPGYGVFGQDNVGTASNGDYNIGTVGASTFGTALLGEANGSPALTLYGSAPIGVYAVAATASGTKNPFAFAFLGETNSFGLDIHSTTSIESAYVLSPGNLIDLENGGSYFYVDTSGNAHLSGMLTTSKGTYVRTTGASGTAMMEYSDRMTVPQVEDVGEAQLANGRAYVTIDARLADTIDRRTAYHVFVTPEGDSNQLYVTQKSAAGFEVREAHGGRSSIAFDYRIVAKPLDDDGTRLAIARPEPKRVDDGFRTGRQVRAGSRPLSPEERLKRRIGTQAYAEAMLQLRARQKAMAP